MRIQSIEAITDFPIMLTRSSVATAATSTRHPQADQAFKEGVESVFRQWTALELAVAHQWGGRSSSDKAKWVTSSKSLYLVCVEN